MFVSGIYVDSKKVASVANRAYGTLNAKDLSKDVNVTIGAEDLVLIQV